jgi:hypothetical protein
MSNARSRVRRVRTLALAVDVACVQVVRSLLRLVLVMGGLRSISIVEESEHLFRMGRVRE